MRHRRRWHQDRGGVVVVDGRVLEELTVESPAGDVGEIVEAIAALVTDLASRHDIACVGIGAAGYVDSSRSHVMFAPNLAWRDLDLRAEIVARVRLPVVVENDSNAAAWREFAFGVGQDVDDLLLVTVGTGVGGGIVLDGKLHRGAFGVAAEIGHLRMVRAGGDVTAITGPLITRAGEADDAFAIDQLAVLGTWLGEEGIDPIRDAFGKQLTGRGHRPVAEIRKAQLGTRAGLIGAADLARR